jgi:peptidoglycan hydrolase CwlO-like protein
MESWQTVVTWIFAIVGGCFSIYFGLKSLSKRNEDDAKESASDSATICSKLDDIKEDVGEIKREVCSLRAENRNMLERIVICETEIKGLKTEMRDVRKQKDLLS